MTAISDGLLVTGWWTGEASRRLDDVYPGESILSVCVRMRSANCPIAAGSATPNHSYKQLSVQPSDFYSLGPYM